MKKIYKTNLGSLVFVGFGVFVFLLFSYWAIVDKDALLWIRVLTVLFTLILAFFFVNFFKYDAIITDDSVSTKIPFLSLFNVYQTMRFDEIKKVYNTVSFYTDMQMIVFKSRDESKKLMSILVGYGLPWQALRDILDKLPKEVEIKFEPYVWKKIKNPHYGDAPKALIATAIILIILSLPFVFHSCRNALRK